MCSKRIDYILIINLLLCHVPKELFLLALVVCMPVLRAPLDTSSDPHSGARRFIMMLARLLVVALLLVVVFADKKTDFHCCSTIFSGVCPECFGIY